MCSELHRELPAMQDNVRQHGAQHSTAQQATAPLLVRSLFQHLVPHLATHTATCMPVERGHAKHVSDVCISKLAVKLSCVLGNLALSTVPGCCQHTVATTQHS